MTALAHCPDWGATEGRRWSALDAKTRHEVIDASDRVGPTANEADLIQTIALLDGMRDLDARAAAARLRRELEFRFSGKRFRNVCCSACGGAFGPGDHGYSSCKSHEKAVGIATC